MHLTARSSFRRSLKRVLVGTWTKRYRTLGVCSGNSRSPTAQHAVHRVQLVEPLLDLGRGSTERASDDRRGAFVSLHAAATGRRRSSSARESILRSMARS